MIQHQGMKMIYTDSIVYDPQSCASFACESCSKLFKRKDALMRHKKCHDASTKLPCIVCNLTFRDSYELMLHMKIKHRGEYFCCTRNDCNRYFKSKSGCINHESKEHGVTTYKKKICNLCHTKFLLKRDYEAHMNAFHGISLYNCKACYKNFVHEHAFIKHSKTCGHDCKGLGYKCSVSGCQKTI